MSRFDQRLEKLEQQTGGDGRNLRIVFLNDGETEQEVIVRTGADPASTLFVRWVRATQGRPADVASA